MPDTPHIPPAWFLAGPTAVGKSAIAVALAARIDGEIISVDSMAVYRGLDIGTAKPDAAERDRVPHHLIDVAGLEESFDVAKFIQLAASIEQAIRSRGRIPIYCGGTGFYFKALFHGIGKGPPTDAALRLELARTPLGQLLEELASRDPETFAVIDRRNPRRIIRALEILRATGRPLAEQRSDWTRTETVTTGHFFAFTRETPDLRRRIDRRVDQMFARGLVSETRELLKAGLDRNPTALQAIGYRQVVEHLRGERALPETVALVKAKTWQFARRQQTWLRHQLGPTWVSLASDADADRVAGDLLEHSRKGPLAGPGRGEPA